MKEPLDEVGIFVLLGKYMWHQAVIQVYADFSF